MSLEVAREELSALPVRALSALPIPSRIRVEHIVTKTLFDLDLGPESEPAVAPRASERKASAKPARRLRVPNAALCAFDAAELEALAVGVEVERAFGSDLTAFALRKQHEPSFRVTVEHALAGALGAPEGGSHLTLGELLHALELSIVGIELVTDGGAAKVAPVAA